MINCEWGIEGINKYSSGSDVTIIVDILSFSTCIDVALSRGAIVYPYPYKDDSAIEFAKNNSAVLANFKRSKNELSLSPYSLMNIGQNEKLVLPSPNGSELSLHSLSKVTLCACLRNYKAVTEYANSISNNITVIPAGEKWQNRTIRFAIEDYLGAGAVISELKGNLSVEADAAADLYKTCKPKLKNIIINCLSGHELIKKGFPEDVEIALEINSGNSVPILLNNCYTNADFP